ncbi:hypothetical protein F0562_010530 [Nyssa sinensis]|uniref:Uncharacterized protein n=1 Tax=Nyssa sinensis TaxID=561372 RepID=A0A5J5A164_9ASTE|nr:hypothetical protein F0562_010530 [Nyssa sinensis]
MEIPFIPFKLDTLQLYVLEIDDLSEDLCHYSFTPQKMMTSGETLIIVVMLEQLELPILENGDLKLRTSEDDDLRRSPRHYRNVRAIGASYLGEL